MHLKRRLLPDKNCNTHTVYKLEYDILRRKFESTFFYRLSIKLQSIEKSKYKF